MPQSKEITGGWIITEHFEGKVVNFFWCETWTEVRTMMKTLDRNQSTYAVSYVVGPDSV